MSKQLFDQWWENFVDQALNQNNKGKDMAQKGIRVTVLMSEREKGMLDWIKTQTKENMSQVVNSLVMQEFYRLKSGEPLISYGISDNHKSTSE